MAQPLKKEPAQAVAKESEEPFVSEPVRPMDQQTVNKTTKRAGLFSFKTPGGKKESVPVITQYYPKQLVYPFGRVDKHIDGRLMQAASIAEELRLEMSNRKAPARDIDSSWLYSAPNCARRDTCSRILLARRRMTASMAIFFFFGFRDTSC